MSNRIPPDFIEDVLLRTDIVELARSWASLSLKKQGANYVALCPFHQEKSPSFNINPNKQRFNCFGCQKNGDALEFVMEFGRLSFKEALELLANQLGLTLPEANAETTEQFLSRKKDLQWLQRVHQFYTKLLWQSPEGQTALAYLRERGLTDETIRHFGLGYAPRNIQVLLSALKQLPNFSEVVKSLGNSGILINKEHKMRSYFFERVLFPIHNRKGEVIAFGGRTMQKDHNPKYLNSPDNALFHKGYELYNQHLARKHIRATQPLWVVEGYMDVIAMTQAGIPACVATLGTAATVHHLKSLLKLTEESSLIFCFDGDQAGQKAANRVLNLLLPILEDGSLVAFVILPPGEDPDSYIKKYGSIAFLQLQKQAMPISEYLFHTLQLSYNLNLVEDRTRFLLQARKMIQQIQAPIFKKLMQQQLQELFNPKNEQPTKQYSQPFKSSSYYSKTSKPKYLSTEAIIYLFKKSSLKELIPKTHKVPALLMTFPAWALWQNVLNWLEEHPADSLASAILSWPNSQEAKELQRLKDKEWPIHLITDNYFKEILQAMENFFIQTESKILMQKSKTNSLNDAERLRLKELSALGK